jgi:hypothetical protein
MKPCRSPQKPSFSKAVAGESEALFDTHNGMRWMRWMRVDDVHYGSESVGGECSALMEVDVFATTVKEGVWCIRHH